MTFQSAAAAFAQAESLARETMQPTDKRYAQVSLESARLALARKDPAAAVTAARSALARIDEQDPGRMATDPVCSRGSAGEHGRGQ